MPPSSQDPVDPAIRVKYAGKLYKLDPRSPDVRRFVLSLFLAFRVKCFRLAERTSFLALYGIPIQNSIDANPQHGDGREEALLNFIHNHPNIANIRGSPSALRAAIDQFGIEKDFLMTTGFAKLEIIFAALQKSRPKVILELGAYIGWGAVAFGGFLQELHPHAKPGEIKLYTFELEPRFAAITSSFVELAGLKHIVEVVVGIADESLRRLKAEGTVETADAALLDHWEKFYLADLQTIEELGLLKSGSVIFADNCVRPPDYLEYVRGAKGRSGLIFRTETVESIMPMGINVCILDFGYFQILTRLNRIL
jgi:catechol O-methyltransferase